MEGIFCIFRSSHHHPVESSTVFVETSPYQKPKNSNYNENLSLGQKSKSPSFFKLNFLPRSVRDLLPSQQPKGYHDPTRQTLHLTEDNDDDGRGRRRRDENIGNVTIVYSR